MNWEVGLSLVIKRKGLMILHGMGGIFKSMLVDSNGSMANDMLHRPKINVLEGSEDDNDEVNNNTIHKVTVILISDTKSCDVQNKRTYEKTKHKRRNRTDVAPSNWNRRNT